MPPKSVQVLKNEKLYLIIIKGGNSGFFHKTLQICTYIHYICLILCSICVTNKDVGTTLDFKLNKKYFGTCPGKV